MVMALGEDKRFIITGAASGMGAATVTAYARAGLVSRIFH